MVSIFAVQDFVGGYFFSWLNNSKCFTYLGCNAGFFGYDALVHFFSGMTEAVFIFWLAEKSQKFNFLHKSFWKNAIIIISIVALLGIGWEIIEFSYDQIRTHVLHQNLLDPNRLVQPNNIDTMGDLISTLIGALVILVIMTYNVV